MLCAATELPLSAAEVADRQAEAVADALVDDGLLRRRAGGYFPRAGLDPHAGVDIRGNIGGQVAILEADTGRLIGITESGQAPATVHPGAVYLHQGELRVDSLDLNGGVALVHAEDPGYATFARDRGRHCHRARGAGPLRRSDVGVGTGVGNPSGGGLSAPAAIREVLDFVELDMPEQSLPTTAAMWTITPDALLDIDIEMAEFRLAAPPSTPRSACYPGGQLRPRRYRWPVHRCRRGRTAHGIRLATATRRCRFRRTRVRLLSTWLTANRRSNRGVRVPARLPVLRAVSQCGNANDPLDKLGAIGVLRLVTGAVKQDPGEKEDLPRATDRPSNGRWPRLKVGRRTCLPPDEPFRLAKSRKNC